MAGAGGIGSMRQGIRYWRELEKVARDDKKGLWADPAPIPPWVYRKTSQGGVLER